MRRIARFLILLALVSCGGNGLSIGIPGCAGMDPRPFDVTPENTVSEGVRTTVTSAGLDFLVAHREALARTLFQVDQNGHVQVPLPDGFSFGNDSIGAALRDVVADIDLRGVDVGISFLPDPARIHFELRHARVGVVDGVVVVTLGGDAACRLGNGLYVDTPDASIIDVDIAFDVVLNIGEGGRFHAEVQVLPFTVNDLNVELIEDGSLPECNDGITDAECPLFCGVGDAATDLVEALAQAFRDQLDSLLQPIIQDFVDSMLDQYNDQPLAIEGAVAPGPLVSALMLPLRVDANPLLFRTAPSAAGFVVRANGDAADGLDLTMDLGLDTFDHPCVPTSGDAPVFQDVPLPDLNGRDGNGDVYHLGMSLSDSVVNRALWVMYRSGVLCLELDSDAVQRIAGLNITTGTLAGIVPGLKGLTGGPRPLMITLDPAFTPADFPLVRFHPVQDDGGIPQAAIDVTLPRAGISVYTKVEERWSRLFQGQVDVSVSLKVTPTPDEKLHLAIDPPQLTNLTETYDELLGAVDIQRLLTLFLNVATAILPQDGIPFDLGVGGLVSRLTGLPIDARIVALETGGDTLSVLLSLADAGPGSGATAAVETRAEVVSSGAGVAELAVEGGGRYQWRVDGGPWRSLRAAKDGRLTVDDPLLGVLGTHRIAVRGVAAGDYRTLDPTPAVVEVETRLPEPAAAPERHDDADGGCAQTSGAPALPLLALLALVRRRRVRA
jgi:hypothetical protein